MKDTNIYNMKLHETVNFHTDNAVNQTVVMVPGGWVYIHALENGTGGFSVSSVFVPFPDNITEVSSE